MRALASSDQVVLPRSDHFSCVESILKITILYHYAEYAIKTKSLLYSNRSRRLREQFYLIEPFHIKVGEQNSDSPFLLWQSHSPQYSLASPCLCGLLRLWRRTFTLAITFFLVRDGFFFRSTLRSRVLDVLITHYFYLLEHCQRLDRAPARHILICHFRILSPVLQAFGCFHGRARSIING
jgi:hypothetical protein